MSEINSAGPLFENDDTMENTITTNSMFVSAIEEHIDNNTKDMMNGQHSSPIIDSTAELETVPIIKPTINENLNKIETLHTNGNEQYIEIHITEPQRIGDGMGSYVTYRITTKTNMSIFKSQEFSVTRRFSDFLGLHDKLIEKYLKMGRIIPPAPQKNVVGTTKLKIVGQTDTSANNGVEFLERRRASLERFLKRISLHPVLSVDPDVREFLEADIELPKATNTSALSSAGMMRLFNKVGETVNKITYKMDETDPWFEDRLAHIETLEIYLKKLHNSVESLVNYRRELSHLTSGVARSAALISACEDHNPLSRALAELADTEEKVEALHSEQANTDFFILCELLQDYLRLLGAVRDTFHERIKLFQHWQYSQQSLVKKREAKAKLEMANRQDRIDQANNEIMEWEAKVERGQENFDKISKMIKIEVERFEMCRINDFKAMFIKYLENHLSHQAQLVKYWEEFLPNAKAIV